MTGREAEVASPPATPAVVASEPGALRSDPTFRMIWTASTVSELGTAVSELALPPRGGLSQTMLLCATGALTGVLPVVLTPVRRITTLGDEPG